MKKVCLGIFLFCLAATFLSAKPKKSEFGEYLQTIENQTEYTVSFKLLNESTYLYDQYTIEPNSTLQFSEVISLKQNNISKRILILDRDIYIEKMTLIGENQWKYVFKSSRAKKATETETYWDEDFDESDLDSNYDLEETDAADDFNQLKETLENDKKYLNDSDFIESNWDLEDKDKEAENSENDTDAETDEMKDDSDIEEIPEELIPFFENSFEAPFLLG